MSTSSEAVQIKKRRNPPPIQAVCIDVKLYVSGKTYINPKNRPKVKVLSHLLPAF